MRPTILFIFLVPLFFSCANRGNNPSTQKTIITGQVSNFEEVSEHDVVQFIYQDLLAGQQSIDAYINTNGRFRFEPEIDHPTEFY